VPLHLSVLLGRESDPSLLRPPARRGGFFPPGAPPAAGGRAGEKSMACLGLLCEQRVAEVATHAAQERH